MKEGAFGRKKMSRKKGNCPVRIGLFLPNYFFPSLVLNCAFSFLAAIVSIAVLASRLIGFVTDVYFFNAGAQRRRAAKRV